MIGSERYFFALKGVSSEDIKFSKPIWFIAHMQFIWTIYNS